MDTQAILNELRKRVRARDVRVEERLALIEHLAEAIRHGTAEELSGVLQARGQAMEAAMRRVEDALR